MKKRTTLTIAAAVVFLALLMWYGIYRVSYLHSKNSPQGTIQALREQTAIRNAKDLLRVQQINALTEKSIQTQLATEAIRLGKLGVTGEEKRKRLDSEEARLRATSPKLRSFLVTPQP